MSHASIYIGFDPRESAAFAVAAHSIQNQLSHKIRVRGIVLAEMQKQGLYTRPTETKLNGEGRVEMVDVLSKREDYDGRISTEFAISRFLTPHLARRAATANYGDGAAWALFTDCDVMARADLCEMFGLLDDKFAVMCVQHDHAPANTTKMDGQVQTVYPKKNWSSVTAFNLNHPGNNALSIEMINTLPGRDLHRFCWLDDAEIGALPPEWNFLVGHSDPKIDPKLVHYTDGPPNLPGYENAAFADEWRHWHNRWASRLAA